MYGKGGGGDEREKNRPWLGSMYEMYGKHGGKTGILSIALVDVL